MPQYLIGDNKPFDPSGFLMDSVQSVEVTLCGDPAVSGAKFRVIRSAGEDVANPTMKVQSAMRKNKYRQQVSGYVSIPWLEDWYGDVMDPTAIEHAAHSYLKNLSNGKVMGNGVGEEHTSFWNNAHVVESLIDKDGSLGGVPGGWWIKIQVTDNETWEKILNGNYKGFSLGGCTAFTNTRSDDFIKSVYSRLSASLSKVNPVEPTAGKTGHFDNPGDYGFPTERSAYADPNNNKFPINTRSRAFASLRHILNYADEEGYNTSETKYMIQRAIAAIHLSGDSIPDDVLERVGFINKTGVDNFVQENGIKCQSTPKINKEEPIMSLTPEILQAIEKATDTAVKAQSTQLQTVLDKLNNVLPTLEAFKNQASDVKNDSEDDKNQQSDAQNKDDSCGGGDGKDKKDDSCGGGGNGSGGDKKKKDDSKDSKDDKPDDAKNQSIDAMVQNAVREVLKTQAQPAASEPKAQDSNLTMADLQAALTQFGKAIVQGIADSNTNTVNAMQSVADRISEMPVPRATVLRTMNHDQKSSFIESMKRKIESGSDISRAEMELATSMGADFSADDPMATIGF